MRRRRSVLLTVVLFVISVVVLTAKKIFDYAAAPTSEKESSFVFPNEPEQQKIVHIETPAAIHLAQRGGFTDDASHLNRTSVYGIVKVRSEEDVSQALHFAREKNLKVSCAGERHSMGGQSFVHGGLVLDFRDFNQINLDKQHMTVNVQSGVRWWQLQELLDREGLSVSAMQSINLFSIGGTLSVNAHGLDPTPGPIAPTVRSMRVMLSSGEIVMATPTHNAELFRHVLGGYGLFGVILDADLELVKNEMYERKTVYMDYKDLPGNYAGKIEHNENIGLVFARLSVAPRSFLRETALHTYTKTNFEGALPPLKGARHNAVERFVINFSKTGSFGRWVRWTLEKRAVPSLYPCVTRNQAMNQKEPCLVSRNGEMYDDMAYLKNRLRDTDILQEYFVPYSRLPEFVDGLRDVVRRNEANLLNVTIRTVHKDAVAALPYAKEDMFALVLYFNVKFNDKDNEVLRKTTVELIDRAHEAGGTFYLPYQLFYSTEQLRNSYPEIESFFNVKRKFDPGEIFTNRFYEKYGSLD